MCDRATVLREGATVGVVDINEGSEERIVALMLGERAAKSEAQMAAQAPAAAPPVAATTPRLAAREPAVGGRLHDVSFELRAGEVLGVAALEGQGQDELFDILAGARATRLRRAPASTARRSRSGIRPMPSGPGVVYVPADRAEALLMQRSIRENVALPYIAGFRSWGPVNMSAERTKVNAGDRRAPDRYPRRLARSASSRAGTSRR